MENVPPTSTVVSPLPRSWVDKIKNFFVNKKQLLIVISLIIILLVAVILGFKIINKGSISTLIPEKWDKLVLDQKYMPAFTLSPSEDRKYGIISQEIFVLKTKDPQTEAFISDNLVSSKPVSVSRVSDTEFKVVPVKPLGIEETISMYMKSNKDYSWAFETAPKLKVVSNLPSNEAKNVPVNTGIEITFNNDSFNMTANDIQTEPRFDFRIEKHDQVSAIVPLKPLDPETVYKITVKKGFGLLTGGNLLTDDFVFSFQTGDANVNQGRLSLAKTFQEIFPDEPLVTKVYSGKWDANQIINAQVYKFPSVESFLASRTNVDKAEASWVSYYGEKDMVDTRSLSHVLTADVKIQTKDQLQYLQLPQNLDEGLYLVQFWFDGYKKVEQLWVQSGTVVGYVSVGKLQTAVWINSSVKESLDGSTIQILGTGNTYSANTQGWSTFPTPEIFNERVKHYLLVTSPADRRLILPVDNLFGQPKPGDVIADDYWSYLYHERVLYKPNDTVYFWGVAKNRDSGSPPAQVDIYLGTELKSSVTPNSDGSFIGKINLVNEPTGYTNLSARIGNVTLASSYFQISNYVKPELKIDVEGNKKAIFAGESVGFKARVTFFDGTPASNVNLYISSNYSGSGTVDKSQATADTNGYISFTYQSKVDSPGSYPRYEGVTVSAIKSGEGPSDGSASVYVYGSKLQINTQSSQNNNQATLSIKVNTLDLNLVNVQGKDSPISGIAANQKVHLTNTKEWSEAVQSGTYYDYVEKTTKPSYNYTNHSEVVDSKDLYTNDQGQIQYGFQMDLNRSYIVKVAAVDDQNRPAEASSYFYYSDYQNNINQSATTNLNMDRSTNYFSLGEIADITLQKNGALYQKTDASRFLFVVANRGRQDVFVTTAPELKLTFESRDIPNVYVGSIIFNGRFYEEVKSICKNGWRCGGYDFYNNNYFFDPILLVYKADDSKLDVNISQDKVKYQPGDAANIVVKVTKGGNAVAGAEVQLTLVDEALASIGGVNVPSILASLYGQVGNFIYYNYYSHRPVFPDGPQAERGGGGGGRDLFKDTAFFGTSQTDGNGEAKFEIKLPDNITNWLTFAQALTPEVDAGQAESSVIATKDYFVTSQFPAVITLKDSPFVAVSSFGNVLSANVKIPVEASFYNGDSLLAKQTANTDAFKESYFAFPKLTVGGYKVTVSGQYQNYQDAVTLPLQVVDSRLDFNIVKNKILSKGDTIKSFDNVIPAAGKPVKLVVTDEGKGKYYYNLYSYCYQNSNRLEKRIASIEAAKILSDRFKDTGCDNFNSDLTNFQNSDGGLKQVVWGDSDLETTVWAVYVDPSAFNKEQLVNYFKNANRGYGTTTETSILRNWGLTLMGSPDINELNRLASTATTFKEKILAALALYSAGNTERSKTLYYQILSEYAYTNKPYLRIQADPNKNDYGTYALDTSYVLLLGTLNQGPYTDGFSLYLRDYSSYAENVVLDIANISYLDYILSTLPDKDTSISFKSDSQNITKNITRDGALMLNLKGTEVNKFDLTVVDGKADASINYFVTSGEFSNLPADPRLSLKKVVTKVKGSAGGGIKIGDILQVTLHYDFNSKAPEGCYTLTDHIPSGMTYLDSPDNYDLTIGRKGTLYIENQNIVKGCAYNSYWWKFYTNNDSTYFERVTGVGKFVQEPAIIQAGVDPSIFQKTSEEYVNVEQ